MIIIMGSVLLAFFIAVPVVIIFFVSETSYLEKLILSLIFLLLFPALALMMVGTGVKAIRRPTQRVILMIDMDDEGFEKWVKGGLLYSQIEGQLNDSHVAYERRKPYGSDIVYRLASGIEIQVRHSKSIVVDDDGERSMVWVVVAIEDITAGRLEEGRALQALLDDLPMFGEEFRMSDILVHPH